MQLTEPQERAVNKLFDAYLQNKKSVYFSAPTGAGKTFMASSLISKIFAKAILKNKKVLVIVATVSNAKLPLQFKNKLDSYRIYHDFKNYDIEFISSPSTSKSSKRVEQNKDLLPQEQKIYVFGTSSFGTNTIFFENNTLQIFLTEAKRQKIEIVFIRDEAHIGAKKIPKDGIKRFDQQVFDKADFIVKMTATPRTKIDLIELMMADLEDDENFFLKDKKKEKILTKGKLQLMKQLTRQLPNLLKSEKIMEKH